VHKRNQRLLRVDAITIHGDALLVLCGGATYTSRSAVLHFGL
jgi:hypothetical protein